MLSARLQNPHHRMRVLVYLALVSMLVCQLFFNQAIYLRTELWSQPWRLWTAHWVHITLLHWLFNAAALVLLPEIFWRARPRLFVLLWFVLPVTISLMFCFFLPNLTAYAGLSGVLHGIYLALALDAIRSSVLAERRMGWLISAGAVGKVAFEAYSGSSQTAELIGANVILAAHQYGAVLGVLCYCTEQFTARVLKSHLSI